MRKTFFVLRNQSQSEGMYLIDGEYKTLYPGEEKTLEHEPTSKTSNLFISMYRKEVSETPVLNKKKR